MQDCLEFVPGVLVGEDNGTHRGAVKSAARREDVWAEYLADFVECGLTRAHDFPRDDVGVNDRHAEFSEHPGDARLAARDASGQADSQRFVI